MCMANHLEVHHEHNQTQLLQPFAASLQEDAALQKTTPRTQKISAWHKKFWCQEEKFLETARYLKNSIPPMHYVLVASGKVSSIALKFRLWAALDKTFLQMLLWIILCAKLKSLWTHDSSRFFVFPKQSRSPSLKSFHSTNKVSQHASKTHFTGINFNKAVEFCTAVFILCLETPSESVHPNSAPRSEMDNPSPWGLWALGSPKIQIFISWSCNTTR